MAVIPADPCAAADTRERGHRVHTTQRHNDQLVHVQSSERLCPYQS